MSLFQTLVGGARTTVSGPISAGSPYDSPGSFTTGIWLVLMPNGTTHFSNRANLPAVGTGAKYYWLGSTLAQINPRIKQALGSLTGAPVPATPQLTQQELQKILDGKRVGVQIKPGPGSPAAVAGSFFGTIGDALSSTLDFLKLIAWLFHPRNILRAVEFIVGLMAIVMGIKIAVQQRFQAPVTENALDAAGLGRIARNLSAAQEKKRQASKSAPSRQRSSGSHEGRRRRAAAAAAEL